MRFLELGHAIKMRSIFQKANRFTVNCFFLALLGTMGNVFLGIEITRNYPRREDWGRSQAIGKREQGPIEKDEINTEGLLYTS